MKVIIAGPRDFKGSIDDVEEAVAASGFSISEAVVGCADGTDALGAWWALYSGTPFHEMCADWKRLGKVAGLIRNEEMAQYAVNFPLTKTQAGLIVVRDKISNGTNNMIKVADQYDMLVYIHSHYDRVVSLSSPWATVGAVIGREGIVKKVPPYIKKLRGATYVQLRNYAREKGFTFTDNDIVIK